MSDRRHDIDMLQLDNLVRFRPSGKVSLGRRVWLRLEENFFGKPLPQKIEFTVFASKWVFQRVRARLNGRSLGFRPSIKEIARPGENNDLKVAAYGFGAIGDLIGYATFLQKFNELYGPMTLDFFCPGVPSGAKFVMHGTRIRNVFGHIWFGHLRNRYDMAITLHHMVRYDVMRPARLCDLRPELAAVIAGAAERYDRHKMYSETHPTLDGLFARLMVYEGRNRQSTLAHFGNIDIPGDANLWLSPDVAAYGVLKTHDLEHRRYITIHDGYDDSYRAQNGHGRATKQWPLGHWRDFVVQFKMRFPEFRVVQLGSGNSGHIEGVDYDLVGKTTLHEAAWIIKNAVAHVDGESGLVRIARALHTRSVVMFGPTNREYFALTNNIDLVAECTGCWWSREDWMSLCPRGLPEPECMTSIGPSTVVEATARIVAEHKHYAYTCSEVEFYDVAGLLSRDEVLQDIFAATDLPRVPISEHAENRAAGVYLHASKQWEYLYALNAIGGASGLKIADLGGGRGALAPYLATCGHNVDIFDLDYLWDHQGDTAVEHRFINWAKTLGAKPQFGSIFNVPAEDARYDVVVSISVMEHLPFKQYAVREALRILKPGGILILTFDFTISAQLDDHRMRIEILTPQRLAETLRFLAIDSPIVDERSVLDSVRQIHADAVRGIPEGITVGGMVVRKSSELPVI